MDAPIYPAGSAPTLVFEVYNEAGALADVDDLVVTVVDSSGAVSTYADATRVDVGTYEKQVVIPAGAPDGTWRAYARSTTPIIAASPNYAFVVDAAAG